MTMDVSSHVLPSMQEAAAEKLEKLLYGACTTRARACLWVARIGFSNAPESADSLYRLTRALYWNLLPLEASGRF